MLERIRVYDQLKNVKIFRFINRMVKKLKLKLGYQGTKTEAYGTKLEYPSCHYFQAGPGIVPVLLVNASGAFLNKLKIFEEITNKMFI